MASIGRGDVPITVTPVTQTNMSPPRRHTGWYLAIVITVAVATTASCAPTQREQAAGASGATAPAAGSAAIGDAVAAFRTAVGDDPSFVDLALVDGGVIVEVTGSASERVTAAVAEAPADVPFKLRTVPNSLTSLQSMSARLLSDQSALRDQGIVMTAWSLDFDTNKVLISLERYTDDAAHTLVTTYGADLVQVSRDPEPIATAD